MSGTAIALLLSHALRCFSVRVQPSIEDVVSIAGKHSTATRSSKTWFNSFFENGDENSWRGWHHGKDCKKFLMDQIGCEGMQFFCSMWKKHRQEADLTRTPGCEANELDDWCGGTWKNETECAEYISETDVVDEDNACEKSLLEKMTCWNKPSVCQKVQVPNMQPGLLAKVSPSCSPDHLKAWCAGGLNAVQDCDIDALDHVLCKNYVITNSKHVKSAKDELQQWCKFLIELNLDQYNKTNLRDMPKEEFDERFGPENPYGMWLEQMISSEEFEAEEKKLLEYFEAEGVEGWFGSRAAFNGCTTEAMTSICKVQGTSPDDATVTYPLKQKWTDDIRLQIKRAQAVIAEKAQKEQEDAKDDANEDAKSNAD